MLGAVADVVGATAVVVVTARVTADVAQGVLATVAVAAARMTATVALVQAVAAANDSAGGVAASSDDKSRIAHQCT